MKLPRGFFIFLSLAQLVLLLGHYALYGALVFFFPFFGAHAAATLAVLAVLAVSFLAFSILDFRSESEIFRIGYIAAGVWLPAFFYLLMASLILIVADGLGMQWKKYGLQYILFWLAIVISLYGIVNARVARITQLTVKLPNLPEIWKGKTAVLVTDLHLGHVLRYGFAGKIITKVNKLKPDIVFIPGDFFDGVKTNFADLANLFRSVKSRHGVYYVTGNHEAIAGYGVCEQALAGAGFRILENSKTTLDGLQIAGLAYQHESDDSVRQLLHSMGIDREQPSILLKHVPSHVEAVAHSGISLMLSGHTHHGQVWPFRYITKKVFGGFDYGLKKMNQLQVYTSSGVGTWGPPVRIFTKSEIVKITLE